MSSIKVAFTSPSNIAIVKYWGKFAEQLPLNPSLSFTLDISQTEMVVERTESDDLTLEFYFENILNEKFSSKILKKLERFSQDFAWIKKSKFTIHSKNSFPHSTGIASSASSMSALAMCLTEIDKILNSKLNFDFQLASSLARIGSGSAARSIFSQAAIWGKTDVHPSSDFFATELNFKLPEIFASLQDTILIVSSNEKKVSSTAGHELMTNHPHKESRIKFANANIKKLIEALKNSDFKLFAEVAEHEALDLHAMMMTSTPSFILLEPNSLAIIQEIRKFREENNVNVSFTIDAGPNIHLLYPRSESTKIELLIANLKEKNLFQSAIYDRIGMGAKSIY